MDNVICGDTQFFPLALLDEVGASNVQCADAVCGYVSVLGTTHITWPLQYILRCGSWACGYVRDATPLSQSTISLAYSVEEQGSPKSHFFFKIVNIISTLFQATNLFYLQKNTVPCPEHLNQSCKVSRRRKLHTDEKCSPRRLYLSQTIVLHSAIQLLFLLRFTHQTSHHPGRQYPQGPQQP